MKEAEAKPSLRISHIVYGRLASGDESGRKNRVTYLVDPKGGDGERDIPENVVLTRWRRRRFPGYTFSGARLSPTLWRALPLVLGDAVDRWSSLAVEEIERARGRHAPELGEKKLKVPAAEIVAGLVCVCGARQLRALVDRHASPEHFGRSGVPDLFLFARDSKGRPAIPRFVEVKKPEEPVSEDQKAEIQFMRDLGLHARVLRLIERKLPAR